MPSALGMYIFAGGFTLGIKEHFDVLAHLEAGEFGAETSIKNIGVEVRSDPYRWAAEDFNHIDLVYANPPCAPFSSSRAGSHHWNQDLRISCIHSVFDTSIKLRPSVFTFESVTRIMTYGRALIEDLETKALSSGYSIAHVLINAADCGLPQTRRRYFFVAHKNGFHPVAPSEVRSTVRDTLGATQVGIHPKPRPAVERWYQLTPPGTRFFRAFDKYEMTKSKNHRGHFIGRPPFACARLAWDQPSCTVTGGADFYHPDEPRPLSVDELKLICGFPHDYQFTGSFSNQYKEVAQGVTPPAARWIAKYLRESIDAEPEKKPVVRTYDFIRKTPVQEEMEL